MRPIEALVPGVQGRILTVLAGTTAELNLRTVARLGGISAAQASRVLPELVELGVVARRDVPPSALFTLVPDHVAARFLLDIAQSDMFVLREMGRLAATMPTPPTSILVFGSFARGEARATSDIDLVVVRPIDVDDDDEAWSDSLDDWRRRVARLTGNAVEMLEVTSVEAASKLRGRSPLWREIRRDAKVVHGLTPTQLSAARHG